MLGRVGRSRPSGQGGGNLKHCANSECPGLARDGRPGEFEDRVMACLDCGGELEAGAAPEPTPAAFRELVTVYVAPNALVGNLIKSAIEADDIEVFLAGEALTGAIGELPTTAREVSVQVTPEFAERAREIAVQIEQP